MSSDPIHDLLRASLEEATPINLYVGAHQFCGVVTRLDESTLELESESGRTAVYLHRIEAATLVPHAEDSPRRDHSARTLPPMPD